MQALRRGNNEVQHVPAAICCTSVTCIMISMMYIAYEFLTTNVINMVLVNIMEGGILSMYAIMILLISTFIVILCAVRMVNVGNAVHQATFLLGFFFVLTLIFIYIYKQPSRLVNKYYSD